MFSVPTFSVSCSLREDLVVKGQVAAKKGEMIRLPYGVALQGIAQRVIGAIENEEKAHADAMHAIAQYGADAWFPKSLQTMNFLEEYLAKAEAMGFEAGKRANAPAPLATIQ
jgi:hypothetical protein